MTVCLLIFPGIGRAETIHLTAKDTLTALEMDQGDELVFQLKSGRVVHLLLEDTHAVTIERVEPGGVIYTFGARIRVDGQSLTVRRYVCCQECFYEPFVINGVRIWLDTVKDVFDLIPIRYPRKGNLQCLPRKHARLALQDMTLRICPEQTSPWIDDGRTQLNVGHCYNGDDSYLGPYLGQACHVGLDVNHNAGSILAAPITLDTHAYFNSVEAGDNNNRWRGIRRWANGDVWALQTHHLIELLVPPNRPLKKGSRYATTAGVWIGSHEHTHFEFKIGRPARMGPDVPQGDPNSIAAPIDFDDSSEHTQSSPEVLHLDPWIVFWQTFEDKRLRDGKILAAINPVKPVATGQQIEFSAKGSRPGAGRETLNCIWTFGDGGVARGMHVSHTFSKAGVYPVTVFVDDGQKRACFTQHVTVSGMPVQLPILALVAEDEPTFRCRPVSALDTYGQQPRWNPHTLRFTARASRPQPRPKIVSLKNIAGEILPAVDHVDLHYLQGDAWLRVTSNGRGNHQSLKVDVDASGLAPGTYRAVVSVHCRGVANSCQAFGVRLQVPATEPKADVIVDNEDSGCYATPYFWVGHRFCRCPVDRRGHQGFYLTNGGRALDGEFVRFTPDLQAGHYTVNFAEDTSFPTDSVFNVRVRHRSGEQTLRVQPTQSRLIGRFHFDQGTDGFVEIHAEGAQGLVVADAIRFQRGS